MLAPESYKVSHKQSRKSHAALRPKRRAIWVPLSLLLSKDLTPAVKFLWIRLRFDETHSRRRSHRPERLANRTSLARSTIYEAVKRAESKGWLLSGFDPDTGKRRWKTACPVSDDRRAVEIPVDLIRASHTLRPQAILCYGLLQALPGFNRKTGEFKWAEIRRLSGLDLRTIKNAIRRLAELYWISMVQKNRVAPIWFRLQDADQAYKEEVERRIRDSAYTGEGLMREFLSLIADTKASEDGARPEFLVNPVSGERLELDRFYPLNKVAFEYNGQQHYVAAGRFTKKQVAAQEKRDLEKRRICKREKISLVIVHAEDLSLTGMLKKVGELLPRRILRGFKQTIACLNARGRGYKKVAANG